MTIDSVGGGAARGRTGRGARRGAGQTAPVPPLAHRRPGVGRDAVLNEATLSVPIFTVPITQHRVSTGAGR